MGVLEFARTVAPAETADYAEAAGEVCRLLAIRAGAGGQARGGDTAAREDDDLRRAEGEEDRCRRLVGDAMESAMRGEGEGAARARAAGWEVVPLDEA